jgi:hypothetical protein
MEESTNKKATLPALREALLDKTNEQTVRDQVKPTERDEDNSSEAAVSGHGTHDFLQMAKASEVTVIYPDFDQVPLSDLSADPASAKFQLANATVDTSTAEIAANSPRYRRRSSTFIDGVHDLPDENTSPMAPAQLYSTMSGRLFHSGRIAIVLVGPPARGKT